MSTIDGLSVEILLSSSVTSFPLEESSLRLSLQERVKELNCLLEVARILVYPEMSVPTALQRIAAVVPGSFSRPEETQIRITYGGDTYTDGAKGDPLSDRVGEATLPPGAMRIG